MFIFLDGKIIDEKELNLSSLSRVLWHSDGVFTTLRVENGNIIAFDHHIKRLQEQASMLEIDIPELNENDLIQLLDANNAEKGLYRLKLIVVPLGHSSSPYWIGSRDAVYLARIDPYREISKPIRVKVYPKPLELPVYPIKGHGYGHRIWLKKWAESLGYDDALCLDHELNVLELSNSNIFWVQGSTLFTPDYHLLTVFKGLALQRHFKAYKKVELVKVKVNDLPGNASIFSCNSLHLKVPILIIDN